MTCAACRKPFSQRFNITRYDAAGTQVSSVDVCSAACLLRWAYDFSVSQGMQFAMKVQHMFRMLKGGG